MKKKVTKYLYFLAWLILSLPLIEMNLNLFNLEPLSGYFEPNPKVEFNDSSFYSGEFQNNYEVYLKDSIGFNSTLIRLNNQIDYSLFDKVNAGSSVVGKENMILPRTYLDSYLGNDLVEEAFIENFVQKFKFVQDTLKVLNKEIFLFLAPGKACVYPELIPKSELKLESNPNRITNYSILMKHSSRYQIQVFDMISYLIEERKNIKYPLFPKRGVHWTGNTVAIVADTLIDYIQTIQNKKYLDIKLIPGEVTYKKYRYTDYDIGEAMNLLWDNYSDQLHYPKIEYNFINQQKKPRVLAVGDSYFQSFVGFYPIIDSAFAPGSMFWYYNKKIDWPAHFRPHESSVRLANLPYEINRTDVFIVEMTDENVKQLGYKFINDLYAHFTNGPQLNSLYLNQISYYLNDPDLNNKADFYAQLLNYPKDLMLNQVIYQYLASLSFYNMSYENRIEEIYVEIRENNEWFEKIKSQAIEKNISLEENLRENAIFMIQERIKNGYYEKQ